MATKPSLGRIIWMWFIAIVCWLNCVLGIWAGALYYIAWKLRGNDDFLLYSGVFLMLSLAWLVGATHYTAVARGD